MGDGGFQGGGGTGPVGGNSGSCNCDSLVLVEAGAGSSAAQNMADEVMVVALEMMYEKGSMER
ncbi:hypothetical protein ACH5RR_006954, partial [Cinchona calisaya]